MVGGQFRLTLQFRFQAVWFHVSVSVASRTCGCNFLLCARSPPDVQAAKQRQRMYLATCKADLSSRLETHFKRELKHEDFLEDAVKEMHELVERAGANNAALTRILAQARKQTKNLRVARPLKFLRTVVRVDAFMGKKFDVRPRHSCRFRVLCKVH